MDVPFHDKGIYRFDGFVLDPLRRSLSHGGARIALHGRPFDTLLYLLQHHDRVVTRAELFAAVWPDRVVEENNLGQAIAALRRALQDRAAETLILTVPGRGYRIGVAVEYHAGSQQPHGAPDGGGEVLLPAAARETAAPPAAAARRSARTAAGRWMAFALLGAALAAGAVWSLLHRADRAPPFAPPSHSLAVLAFTNLSGNPARDYLSDGLADEVIDRLGRIGALHVAGRQSSFSFKQGAGSFKQGGGGGPRGTGATINDIARRLNVGAVLEGSVREAGPNLQITARLVDGVSGFRIWSETYDAAPRQAPMLASEIAAAVTTALNVKLSTADTAQLTLGGTTDPAALDAYLHGLQLGVGGGEAARRPALAAFEQAIAHDPNYAMAHLYRGVFLDQIGEMEGGHDEAWTTGMEAEAKKSVRRAIEIAPDLGAAHAKLAEFLLTIDWDFAGALAEISRALILAPGDPQTRMSYANLQIIVGHKEIAEQAAYQAAALDPLSPRIYRQLANLLIQAREYEAAQVALRHARQSETEETPNDRYFTALVELGLGHPAEAARLCAGSHDWNFEQLLAIADHALGRDEEAAKLLADLQQRLGDSAALQYAEVYAQWGRTQDALKWLKTAMRLRDPGLAYLRASPTLDPIMQTADFKDIERQLHFPP
jgi:serine/threonine-protein kinase